jgi:flavodoxin
VGGSIVNLPIGNTEIIAKKIQELTGSDMFRIETVKTYPEDYTETTNVARSGVKRMCSGPLRDGSVQTKRLGGENAEA